MRILRFRYMYCHDHEENRKSVSIPEILQLRIQQREMQDSGLNLRLAVLPDRVMGRLRDVAIPVKFL